VSKVVPAPHVSIVAVPDASGVHASTASGAADVAVAAQLPASALDPAVTPVTTPPSGGTTIGAPHVPVPPASVLDVVELVVVTVVDGPVPIVIDVEVLVVDVLPAAGGVTVSANAPLEPPHEPA